jgi:cyclophilin family peptidyl-prolyl cis-trans isomerase
VLELFQRVCPKTCDNFKTLCVGKDSTLSYHNSPFHRILPGAWIQGGDLTQQNGTGGMSIYGETFADENFAIRYDRGGVLAMANRGPHTNSSQFFITVAATPWLHRRNVAFGRVVKNMSAVRAASQVEVAQQAPQVPVVVERAGLVDMTSFQHIK